MTITMTITIKTMTMMIINTTICVLYSTVYMYISRPGECTVVDDSTHLAREREKGQMLLDHHR